jgi:hypothetical protein
MRTARVSIVASLLLTGGLVGGPPSRATCGSANCFLMTGTQEGVNASGILTIDLSYRFISQGRRLSGSHEVPEVLAPKIDFENGLIEPDHHREIRTQNTLVEIDLSYGLTPRLTLAGSLPIINQRDHEHFDDVGTPEEHFTREDGSSGFGDVRFGARYAFVVKTKNLLSAGMAVKLPTGAYTLHDGEGDINEPTIQPGTGSTDAILSVQYVHQVIPERLQWFLAGAWRKNGENDLDYRFGDETIVNAGLRHRISKRVAWSAQANWRDTGRDRFLSQDVPSTGVTFLDLTPGLTLDTGTGTVLYGFVQLPVSQRVNESQLAPRAAFMTGVSKSF